MSASQLARLLPLPEQELKQVLDYAATLSKPEAVEHFGNLLGDSPDAIDFISSFNSRRQDPKSTITPSIAPHSESDSVPKLTRAARKKKAPLHTPAPRQVANLGPTPGTAYSKKGLENEYISRRSSPASGSSGFASPARPPPTSATPPPPKQPPSAAGHLISDVSRGNPRSTPGSRSSTPGPKTKVNISGGTAMHGASTALSDLDAAIRTLEMTTNPTKEVDDAARKCNCVATRHPLLGAAPNCLNCGKVICVKEGLGQCTFCGTPLLSASEVQSMISGLKQERGRERMAIDKDMHKRAAISRTPAPFTKPREMSEDHSGAEAQAREHRDKLLGFQAQNVRRTTVRDEAADFDVSSAMVGSSGNIWASPEERARELKRQQKIMREMEWNARPEYEKRRQVVSIDLVGGKVVRKMAAVERPESPDDEVEVASSPALKETGGNRGGGGGGAFSKNPLLGGLVKPIFDAKGKGSQLEGRKEEKTRWRKVQDDLDNNEGVILDGGAYGGPSTEQTSTREEHVCG
ncbi:C2HC5 finger protein [Xylariales sp. AK1849]|nr:C2HC5 finger protein [Xylariales sp. AK1849]